MTNTTLEEHVIQISRHDAVCVLTLNRPASLNSLSLEAIKALLIQLRALKEDPAIRALIITGAGRGFCAGWQLDAAGVPGLPERDLRGLDEFKHVHLLCSGNGAGRVGR